MSVPRSSAPAALSLSPTSLPGPSPDRLPPEAWFQDLATAHPPERTWLWPGYLAPGSVTLLTSQGKCGKTTLLSVLLARLKTGGPLLDLPLAAGKALVVSEEPPELWVQRGRKLGFGDQLCLQCRPFPGKPTREQWQALLARLADLHARHHFALIALDPLAEFLPGHDESNAGTMLEYLLALRGLANQGAALLLPHHPRKKAAPSGQAARGSGALIGCADIVLELRWYRQGEEDDRRRRLYGWSRYEETPRQLVIELTADGRDYLCHGSASDEADARGWQRVCDVLASATDRLTQKEILERWPAGVPQPAEATLWRWLDRAVAQGLVCRGGRGTKSDPYRYWLAAQEQRWLADPDYRFQRLLEEQNRQMREARHGGPFANG
jgi:hypothetical protein